MAETGRTLTHVQGSTFGVVSGYLLKVVRESVGATQARLAEDLDVDVTTVQGWESGRRPLTALRTTDLIRLRRKLTRLGARSRAAELFNDAAEADVIIGSAVEAGDTPLDPDDHPLAGSVHRRRLTNIITWPFTGLTPPHLRELPRQRRRGPVADRPALSRPARDRFFDHLLVTADSLRGEEAAVLRRQAIYLLSFDDRDESAEWLVSEHRRALADAGEAGHVPTWVSVRSSAVALARLGDSDPLQHFIDTALSHPIQETANLNYWAYWLGEIPEIHTDDEFMETTDPSTWTGERLLAHLLDRLEEPGHAGLNIHSLWALLLARPDLLRQHPRLRQVAGERIEQAADGRRGDSSQRKLSSLAYAVQLAERS